MDVHDVVEGFPGNTDMVLLMPRLEEATDAILRIAPLDAVLYGSSSDREG